MLNLILTLALLQQPNQVSIPDASSARLTEAVQKLKDLQVQLELGQKDAQNILLQIVIETVKKNPGFNEQDYEISLQDGKYVFVKKKLEDKNVKAPTAIPVAPPKP